MAAEPEIHQKTYELKFLAQAIQKIFDSDSSDFSFDFVAPGDDEKQQRMQINAHKTLLSAVSPVFQAMFSGNWKESTSVEIADASFETFNALIEYFYTENITITAGNVGEVLYLSDKYDTPKLTAVCSEFLAERVALKDVVNCISLALTFSLETLKSKCKEIIGKNIIEVIESEPFLQCGRGALFEILSIDFCGMEPFVEAMAFDSCIKWAQNECRAQNIDADNGENMRNALGNCFDRIRFREMHFDEFGKRITLYKDMFTKDEIVDVVANAKKDVLNVDKNYSAVKVSICRAPPFIPSGRPSPAWQRSDRSNQIIVS